MTDQIPTLSPADAMARADATRTSFEKEAVWLPALAVNHWNAGQMFIENKTFTDCVIEGPAVIAVMNGTRFDSCVMGASADPKTLLFKPMGQKMAGVVGMSNCQFIRCRFFQVGFTGSNELVEELAAGIAPPVDITDAGTAA